MPRPQGSQVEGEVGMAVKCQLGNEAPRVGVADLGGEAREVGGATSGRRYRKEE